VDAVFSRVDDDHDGKLTLAEFEEMMQHNKSKEQVCRSKNYQKNILKYEEYTGNIL